MRRFFCALFGHRLVPGVTLERAIYAHCERCHRLVPGDFALRR